MSKDAVTWTAEQLKAITLDGNILISASAGSGKTTVLVERIIHNITEKKIPINKMLVLTFTELASSEMKEKIRNKLIEKAGEGGENARLLKEQISLLPFSQISTIHSFCMELARSYFDYLAINPAFDIISDMDVELYKAKAFANVIERNGDAGKLKINQLTDVLTDNRKLDELYEIIKQIRDNMETQADKDFFKKQIERQFEKSGIADTERIIVEDITQQIGSLTEEAEKLLAKSKENTDYILALLESLEPFKKSGGLRELTEYRAVYSFRRNMIKTKSTEGEDFLQKLESIKSESQKILKQLDEFCPYDEALLYYKKTKEVLDNLTLFSEEFSKEYQNLKVRDSKVDFNDLETYAIEILRNDMLKEEIRNRYSEVLIDEYQDTNPIQEFIIDSVARDKRFYVGDLKQSIYGFRLCEPAIIKNRYNLYKATGTGEVIDLNNNYRSSQSVIDFVNKIFVQIMTEKTSMVDYRNTGKLVKGIVNIEQTVKEKLEQNKDCNIVLFDKDEVEKNNYAGIYSVLEHKITENDKSVEQEAYYILNEIKKNVGVTDIGGRKCRYGDIAILAKTRKNLQAIVSYLAKYIPLNLIDFEPENSEDDIGRINDFLTVSVNFNQDMPLARALLSHFGGLDEEELAQIRIAYRDENFYDAVKKYSCREDDAAEKLRAFIRLSDTIRFTSSFKKTSTLFRNLLSEGYGEYILSSTDGEKRIANLNAYIEDLDGNRKLDNVIDYLEYVGSADIVAKTSAGDDDSVKVMTIHKSKGLEFPIVFLPELNGEFNYSELKKPFIYNAKAGAGIYYFDSENLVKKETIGQKAVKLFVKNNLQMENIRLFYVALTRAKNKLYLLAREKSTNNEKIPEINKAKSYLQMIKYAINGDADLAALVERNADKPSHAEKRQGFMFAKADSEYLAIIRDTLDYRYPYREASEMLFKHTATSVNKGMDKDTIYKITDDNQKAREGIIYHKVMQYIDFNCRGIEQINIELDKMVESGQMEEDERRILDASAVSKILCLDVIAYAARNKNYREKEFLIKTKANSIGAGESDEDVMVQGVIDLLIVGDQTVLIDFKYSSKDRQTLAETYEKQFYIYELAYKTLFNADIDRKYIINLKTGEQIELK